MITANDKSLFPEYLNPGSRGMAVAMLQMFLIGHGHREVVPDGVYGPRTAAAVAFLQSQIGVEPDGQFGPATREALKKRGFLDINAIPAELLTSKPDYKGP